MKTLFPFSTFVPAAAFFVCVFCACSSAPSKPAEITTERNLAATELKSAYTCINTGRYEAALSYISDAENRAVAVDDPELRVEALIALGAAHLSVGDSERAKAAWTKAKDAARLEHLQNQEALAGLYLEKAEIREASPQEAARISERILSYMDAISKNELYTAFAWQTLGLAKQAEGKYDEAEAALLKSFKIHEKELYLENAAFDWFAMASVRSTAGDYDGALEAIMQALSFDRRSENKFGVGSDWLAHGKILQKAGRPEEAARSFLRAQEIFTAAGFPEKAAEAGALKENAASNAHTPQDPARQDSTARVVPPSP